MPNVAQTPFPTAEHRTRGGMWFNGGTFMGGGTTASQLLALNSSLPEFAFVGRSNAGKSSLLNSIMSSQTLVKVSARPGKTQQVWLVRLRRRPPLALHRAVRRRSIIFGRLA